MTQNELENGFNLNHSEGRIPSANGNSDHYGGREEYENPRVVIIEEEVVNDDASSSTATPTEFDPRSALSYKGDLMYSLAFHRTTPKAAIYLVSMFMILAHLMFAYGQAFPMWRLYYKVDMNMTLHASSLESKALFTQLGISNPTHIQMHEDHNVDTFTYGFAIEQLWKAHNLGSKVGPRIAALLLVLFSGVWPHLKLVLLHVYWLVPHSELVRSSALYWLSTFGKWSLADVFVVCVMIGVLNIDMELDPAAILVGLEHEVPEVITLARKAVTETQFEKMVCEDLLKLKCTHWYDLRCSACRRTADLLYSNPSAVETIGVQALKGIKSEGGGRMELRIAGLDGTYVFCFAVIISLLLSFFIDALDHRAKAKNAKSRRGSPPLGALGVTGSPSYLLGNDRVAEQAISQLENRSDGARGYTLQGDMLPPIPKYGPGPVLLIRRVSRRVWSMRQYIWLTLGAFVAVGVVITGIFVQSMEREVLGSLPAVANKIIGVEWYRTYSLWTLTEVTGASGGADFLLMGTFGFFCVFGPILRALVTVIHLTVPGSKKQHSRLMTVINFLGSFCAWEVFLVALFLVDVEMPPITSTIINSDDTKWCDILHEAGFDPACFQVEFNILKTFLLVVIGGTLLMFVTSLAVKLSFKGLDPYMDGDLGGPYCCECCPPLFIDFHRDLRSEDDALEERSEEAPLLLDDHGQHSVTS
mmetsp:Transcript_12809/g.24847  ORF Transcript_12809/g.24847 Transcript_12809/m.24847 type:complete len:700 (+) Transcript_12809:355-2454(+)|eukprot:CAMPEP_0171539326 /NCGR_PEP_ID=MMETSP0960-20121227/543_1 /TAXON_ID=87120 /ORGANISM="Aurantiochytrium limacinum, Strain ATCCMYA-1381" /LENGTH=699 /DNA_ID=CAMNT_0012086331 /DNA_START=346 /DNA_END=2445 /DNA_ORIENTATION=-